MIMAGIDVPGCRLDFPPGISTLADDSPSLHRSIVMERCKHDWRRPAHFG
jgi:hypothetical protein